MKSLQWFVNKWNVHRTLLPMNKSTKPVHKLLLSAFPLLPSSTESTSYINYNESMHAESDFSCIICDNSFQDIRPRCKRAEKEYVWLARKHCYRREGEKNCIHSYRLFRGVVCTIFKQCRLPITNTKHQHINIRSLFIIADEHYVGTCHSF